MERMFGEPVWQHEFKVVRYEGCEQVSKTFKTFNFYALKILYFNIGIMAKM